MDQKTLLNDYLRQNCRRINTDIGRILPCSLIVCLALIIANMTHIVTYSTGRMWEICLGILICSVAPLIVGHYSYDEHINRIICLVCLELMFCLIARNKVLTIDIVYMLTPMISLLYMERKVFLRTTAYCFLVMVFIKLMDFLWIYRAKKFDLDSYRLNYENMLALILEYIMVAVILYAIYQLSFSLLKTQLLIAYDAVKPVEMVVQETDEVVEEAYNTKGLFLEINQTIQNVIRTKGKTFVLDVDSELPIQLLGDKNKIRVMMISLLTDLVQFSTPGERITLELTYDKGIVPKKEQKISIYCRISCSEDLSKYFDEGLAMNTALAKSILAKMNGIMLEKGNDDKHKGTAYTLCFQQTVADEETLAHAKKIHQYEQKELIADSRKRAQEVLLSRQVKVLVVDDNAMNLKLLDSILKAYGMMPTCVTSGEEALSLLRIKGYDLVILDHMMPIKGGIQTAKEIRQMGEKDHYFQFLPIMAMSSNITEESRQMLYNCGFNSVVSKPIKELEIRQAMTDCMLL